MRPTVAVALEWVSGRNNWASWPHESKVQGVRGARERNRSKLLFTPDYAAVGLTARIATKKTNLEAALSIKLIPISTPIVSGDSGGHSQSITLPRIKVPTPSNSSHCETGSDLHI
jgi:hypothetical protein